MTAVAKAFTCQICGKEFDLPEAVRAKYPGWVPKACMKCRKSAQDAVQIRGVVGSGRVRQFQPDSSDDRPVACSGVFRHRVNPRRRQSLAPPLHPTTRGVPG